MKMSYRVSVCLRVSVSVSLRPSLSSHLSKRLRFAGGKLKKKSFVLLWWRQTMTVDGKVMTGSWAWNQRDISAHAQCKWADEITKHLLDPQNKTAQPRGPAAASEIFYGIPQNFFFLRGGTVLVAPCIRVKSGHSVAVDVFITWVLCCRYQCWNDWKYAPTITSKLFRL